LYVVGITILYLLIHYSNPIYSNGKNSKRHKPINWFQGGGGNFILAGRRSLSFSIKGGLPLKKLLRFKGVFLKFQKGGVLLRCLNWPLVGFKGDSENWGFLGGPPFRRCFPNFFLAQVVEKAVFFKPPVFFKRRS